ncbi:Hypothetical protein SSCIU_01197 [Mammaliicoccus sciuri]|nr:Hypothetical protein SSCIU_01197 [Mammaliicoccus sciuri]
MVQVICTLSQNC